MPGVTEILFPSENCFSQTARRAASTIALLEGSPALDQGRNFGVAVDQRNLRRPFDLSFVPDASGGDGSDIGAYESSDPVQEGALTVTNPSDQDDGTCGIQNCSLREAIHYANALPGPNNVTFAFASGLVTVTQGEIVVTDSVTVHGGGLIQISGQNASRVFTFAGGESLLAGLTIRDGRVAPALGAASGGGILIQANLTLTDCTLAANRVEGADGVSGNGSEGAGGGIHNSGVLNLHRCTLSGKSAAGGDGANAGRDNNAGNGGAIFNHTAGTLLLDTCTVAANTASGGAGGNSSSSIAGTGGAARGGVLNSGTMSVTAGTFSGNIGTGGAGGTDSFSFAGRALAA